MKVLTITNNLEKTRQLKRSLEYFGWDYEIIYKKVENWQNIMKLPILREYLIKNDIEDFIFLDAFDVFCLDTPENTIKKIKGNSLIGVEANCWSGAFGDTLREKHPKTESVFKYVNSGMYYMTKKLFLKLCKKGFNWAGEDDQGWLMKLAIENKLKLDHKANVFLNMIDAHEHFFIKDKKVYTRYKTKPTFIHGNGQPFRDYNMNEIYSLI